MGGIMPFHPVGWTQPPKVHAPLGTTQTFEAWDPVQISSSQLIATPKDGTIALVGEIIGFAAEWARGPLGPSRTNITQTGDGFTGSGATENEIRSFVLANGHDLWQTPNFWTDATGATQDVIGGADMWTAQGFQLASAAAGDWGLVDVGAATATDVECQIVAIYDGAGKPFDADTADTTAGPGNTTIVFRILNHTLFTQLTLQS